MAIGREILGHENRAKLIALQIDVGATGAVSAIRGKGVSSVVRNSAGKYTITLDRGYKRVLGVGRIGMTGAGAPGPVDGTGSVDTTNAGTGSVILYTALTAAPTTAADVASGTTINLVLLVSDSDV